VNSGFRQDVEGDGCDFLKVLSGHLPGGSEESHILNWDSLRFKSCTFRIQARTNYTAAVFCSSSGNTLKVFGYCAVDTAFILHAITASVAAFPTPSGTAARHPQCSICIKLSI
jgi:hypothetical protein